MINPEKRKDLIIMLKLLQNEDAFEKIYDYVRKILSEPEEETTTVSEPVAKYKIKEKNIQANLFFSEKQIQEIIDAYDESKKDEGDMDLEHFFADYKKRRCLSK